MPGKFEIMCAVQKRLNNLEIAKDESDGVWTRQVKTELCKIGRRFGYSVYARANEVNEVHRDGGEWLYDVTWLEYKCNVNPRHRFVLSNAHLVAECEWGDHGDICDDLEKLLLARASVRVMIFDGDHRTEKGTGYFSRSLTRHRSLAFYSLSAGIICLILSPLRRCQSSGSVNNGPSTSGYVNDNEGKIELRGFDVFASIAQ